MARTIVYYSEDINKDKHKSSLYTPYINEYIETIYIVLAIRYSEDFLTYNED